MSYKTIEINENSPPGTWITNLSVIDEDINQPHTCTLLNATQYVTLIGSDRSTLVVSQSAQIDFETFANIWVNVECRDSGVPALGVRRAFHIAVIDVNEAPTKIILNGSRYLREDLSVGDSIAELSVVDDDAGQSHTYAVVGRMAATFTVDNARRQLIVSRPSNLDFENLLREQIFVEIVVSDDGFPQLSFHQTFTFIVVDINEPMGAIVVSGGGTVVENAVRGQEVGVVFSSNEETWQSVAYRIVSVDGNSNSNEFYVQSDGNVTYLYSNMTINYDRQSSFSVEIEAIDNGNPPVSSIETITVTVLATDPCALGTADCAVNANCTRLSSTTSRCSCMDGYAVVGTICRDIDECSVVAPVVLHSISLCNGKGTCVDGIGEYTCTCYPGYTGRDCGIDINECESNPCLNGQCVDLVNEYACQCREGFTGANCEENADDCVASRCGDGTCVDGANDYSCECPEGVTGDRCSFTSDLCKKQLCEHGVCVPKSSNADQITMADFDSQGNELPSVVLEPVSSAHASYKSSASTSSLLCVPDDYIVEINFPAVVNAGSKSFLNEWERHLQEDLVVTISVRTRDGIGSFPVPVSYVYVTGARLQSDRSTTVYFVVVVNDEVVQPFDVLSGLNKDCLNVTLLSHSDEICEAVIRALNYSTTIRPPEAERAVLPSSRANIVGSQIFWPVIGSFAAVVIIVVLALLVRRSWARSRRPVCSLQDGGNDGGVRNGVTNEYTTRVEITNPIYRHDKLERGAGDMEKRMD